MIVKIDKTFEKDTDKLQDKSLLVKIADSIENVQSAKKLSDIKGIRKLRGFEKEYRIRIGDYRLGLIIDNQIVEFIRCIHRKDIYKYFPK